MEDTLQLHEFFVEGGNAERSHALLHITEPSTPEEKQKGYFFVVCEIIGSTTEYIAELQQTIDVIEKGYYEDIERPNAETLEAVLDQVNKQSLNIVRRGIELHWMVGVITGNEIIFSFHGRPLILLFYKNKEGIYQPLDLVAQNPVERTSNPSVFSQIIQGKISPHDYLVVTTPHVREFYDYDRMQRIVTTRSAEESCRHFERAFQESKRDLSFAGVIVTVGRTIERRPAPAPRLPQISRGSSESLQQLFSTEKNTARTLTSSLSKSFQNSLERFTKPDKKTPPPVSSVFDNTTVDNEDEEEEFFQPRSAAARRRTNGDSGDTKDYIFQIFKALIAALVTLGKWLLKFFIVILTSLWGILRFLGTLFLAAINYQGRRQLILDGWKRSLLTFRDHIYHLPLLTKLFFIITILLVIGVSGSVMYLNRQHAQTAAAAFFTTTAQSIEKKKNDADSDLTWQNEDGARQLLAEAQTLFDQLPCKTTKNSSEQQTCQKLQLYLNDLATELRKVVVVQPELLTTFEAPNTSITGLTKVNNFILGYSATNPNIFLYNDLTKETQTLPVTGSSTGFTFGTAGQENKSGYFFTTSKDLIQFNPKDKSLKKVSIAFNKANSAFNSIFIYNYRLYILDDASAQVYRHESIVGGFARGTEWIKSGNQDLSDVTSFAIDGDMYALKKNGAILKFTGGDKQSFSTQNVDPALTSADSIYTYSDYVYLYVLDATQGRIVILTKDGKLKNQLTAPELKGAHGLVIEESNKTGYFVSENKVYKITLAI